MPKTGNSPLWGALLSPYFLPLCLALDVSIRLAVVSLAPIDQYSDNLWYYNMGRTLASGSGYSQGGISTAYWPPGWPGVLGILFWVFGTAPLVGQIANVVFAAITLLLAFRLGSTLFSDEKVGRLAALLLTFYPNQIGYVPVLATEVFYTTLLLLAILIAVQGQRWATLALAGICFGVATLTKAQTLFIPAVLFSAWWLLLSTKRGRFSLVGRAVIVYAAMALVILPWTVRNYHVFGSFVLISTNGGGTLLTGNNPSASGDYTENDALVQQVPNDVARQVANDRLATSLALEWIRDHPVDFLILVPKKVWRLWAPDGESEWAYQAGFKDYDHYWMIFRAIRVLNQLYYTCLILLFGTSFVYFIHEWRSLPTYAGTGYVLAVYFTIVSIIFSGQSRFHFPLMPFVAICAAWTVIQWSKDIGTAPRNTVMIRTH